MEEDEEEESEGEVETERNEVYVKWRQKRVTREDKREGMTAKSWRMEKTEVEMEEDEEEEVGSEVHE